MSQKCSDAVQPEKLIYPQWNVSELFDVCFCCLTGKIKTHIVYIIGCLVVQEIP
jgi:hypothetical protein